MLIYVKNHRQMIHHITRWAPTSYKWSYNPYKWPYNWVTGVITPISGLITILITGRGPTLKTVIMLIVFLRIILRNIGTCRS